MRKGAKKMEDKKYGLVKAVRLILPRIIRSNPVLFAFDCIIAVAHGVFWGVETMFQQRFFDSATALAAGNAQIFSVVIALLLLGAVNIICQLLNGLGNYLPSVGEGICKGKLAREVYDKISKFSPVEFENTEKLDQINKACLGKDNAYWFIFALLSIFAFYIPYFTFMGFYLFSLQPQLAIAIIIVFVPTALTQIVRSKIFAKLEDKCAPVRRQYEYYEKCIVDREYFKETRLLGGLKHFKKLYLEALSLLNSLSFKANIKTNAAEFSMKLLTVAGYGVILFMLFNALMAGDITVGAFAAVTNSIGFIYAIMEEVVCMHLGNVAKELGTVRNYCALLEMPEGGGADKEIDAKKPITLNNVSFTYPGGEKKAVDGVDLVIAPGETIAVVGENGSGKSTLMRLIAGLYIPSEGSVKYGGDSTAEVSLQSLRKNISAVFQKFSRYQMTLRENIEISDSRRKSGDEELEKICLEAGFSPKDESFTQGLDTMLSREFDGADLSGGQWQRIAIARAFYKNSPIIILDEPTAAIDPIEETRIYNKFAEVARDKTAVIVTHRLGSAKIADRILVMDGGKLIEIGTHDELINKDGKYSQMYRAQSTHYTG